MATEGIREFRVITELHPGMEREERVRLVQEPTRAGLAMCQDHRDYLRIRNVGSYGNVGCGRTFVAAIVVRDGEEIEVPINELARRELATLPLGKLRQWWRIFDAEVWNGNNHVPFSPDHSRALWATTRRARATTTESVSKEEV